MSDERSNGGRGGDRDDVDDFGGPEDDTVVISSETFLRSALERMGEWMRAAGDDLVGLGYLADEVGAAPVLAEVDEKFAEAEVMLGGARRAVRRLIEIERKKEAP